MNIVTNCYIVLHAIRIWIASMCFHVCMLVGTPAKNTFGHIVEVIHSVRLNSFLFWGFYYVDAHEWWPIWVIDIVACLNWVWTCFWQFLDKVHYLCLVYPCSKVNVHLWTFCIPQYSQSYMLTHLLTSWNSKVINSNYIQYMLTNYGWAPEKYPSTEVTRSYYSSVCYTVMSTAYNCINVLSIFIYPVFVHAWLLAYWHHDFDTTCTLTCNNTCLPLTHNTRLCWALPYKCWSKVCHVHVVLSTLYQEKMVTEQEVKELKPDVNSPWHHLALIQHTKPPDVVKRTAETTSNVACMSSLVYFLHFHNFLLLAYSHDCIFKACAYAVMSTGYNCQIIETSIH